MNVTYKFVEFSSRQLSLLLHSNEKACLNVVNNNGDEVEVLIDTPPSFLRDGIVFSFNTTITLENNKVEAEIKVVHNRESEYCSGEISFSQ